MIHYNNMFVEIIKEIVLIIQIKIVPLHFHLSLVVPIAKSDNIVLLFCQVVTYRTYTN